MTSIFSLMLRDIEFLLQVEEKKYASVLQNIGGMVPQMLFSQILCCFHAKQPGALWNGMGWAQTASDSLPPYDHNIQSVFQHWAVSVTA